MVLAAVLVAVAALPLGGWAAWRALDDRAPSAAGRVSAGWPEAGSSRTVTVVGPDGVLEVTHWIHADAPLAELEVSLPAPPGAAPGAEPGIEAGEDAREEARDETADGSVFGGLGASGVEVRADGQQVRGPETIDASRASYVFAPATRITIRYRLTGAVQLSSSAPGRGLLTTTSLDVSARQPRDLRVVRSEAVLSLACAARGADPVSAQPCGEPDGETQWSVELEGAEAGGGVRAAVTVPS